MHTPTDAEMSDIAEVIGLVPTQAEDRMPASWPDPGPKILERARGILNGTVEKQVVEVEVVSEEDRVAFLRHLLTGQPLVKTYHATGVEVTFSTVSAQIKVEVDRGVARETRGMPTTEAQIVLSTWRLAHAVVEVRLGDERVELPPAAPRADAVTRWLGVWSEVQLALLQTLHKRFVDRVKYLTDKATGDDSSFWPTLS